MRTGTRELVGCGSPWAFVGADLSLYRENPESALIVQVKHCEYTLYYRVFDNEKRVYL
jgi:hypothetical protein